MVSAAYCLPIASAIVATGKVGIWPIGDAARAAPQAALQGQTPQFDAYEARPRPAPPDAATADRAVAGSAGGDDDAAAEEDGVTWAECHAAEMARASWRC